MAHIATACITDAKSALVIAKALGTDTLILTDEHYFRFLNTVHPLRPWQWEQESSWSGFHLQKANGEYVSGVASKDGETIFIRAEARFNTGS